VRRDRGERTAAPSVAPTPAPIVTSKASVPPEVPRASEIAHDASLAAAQCRRRGR
jgi:hypothetical protein